MAPKPTTNQPLLGSGGVTLTVVLLSVLLSGCGIGYVVRSAYFQAELLASRTPVDEVLAEGGLNDLQRAQLLAIRDIKAFGEEIGLKPTQNYGTVAMDWNRTNWILAACPPLSFQPKTWWFPIVGEVPYLGFFNRKGADRLQGKLESQGYEVYRRVAGAYSTLGWFRDPILLPMLEWDTCQLADTVLHEMVHSTLWIPGSVKFNESFANFVGEEAAFRYLRNCYGSDAPVYLDAIQRKEDSDQWRTVLVELYADLDEVYKNRTFSKAEKQSRKAALLSSLRKRVAGVEFHDTARFLKMATGTWNNARIMQYRTYNHNRDRFQALLYEEKGDLLRFISRIQVITQKRKNPFKALDEATNSWPVEGTR